jgi:hypothetical protein
LLGALIGPETREVELHLPDLGAARGGAPLPAAAPR